MKAINEYNKLSVKQKLSIDINGYKSRPGVDVIRGDIIRLKQRYDTLKRKSGLWPEFKHIAVTQETSHKFRFSVFIYSAFCEALKENDQREGCPRKLLNLENNDNDFISVGKWFIKKTRWVEYDNNRYSKNWHKKYGGVPMITNTVIWGCWYYGKPLIKSIDINNFNGDWLVKSGVLLDLLPEIVNSQPLRLRLKKQYTLKKIEENNGYIIYSRRLLNTHIDYVIDKDKVAYHSSDFKSLLSGVNKKIEAKNNTTTGLIDFKKCRRLGFCKTGIKEFCYFFNLNIKNSYTIEQIKNAISKNIEHAEYVYEYELKKLGVM